MDVFVSWSGEASKEIAKVLTKYLRLLLPGIKPFFSPEGITMGDRWPERLSVTLQECKVGLFCITADNYENPWLLFEAGAISSRVGQGRVIPIFFGKIKPTDIKSPLTFFQCAVFIKEDMRGVVKSIHKGIASEIPDEDVDELFENFWSKLKNGVNDVIESQSMAASQPDTPKRSSTDLLHEILGIVRDLELKSASSLLLTHTERNLSAVAAPITSEITGSVLPGSTGTFVEWTQLLHQFAHIIRNKCLMMMPNAPVYSTPYLNDNVALPNFILAKNKEYFISLLETLADLFKLVAPADAKVWVSLRDRRADDNYHTFARAGVYNRRREDTSQPIHKDANVLARLKENYKNNCCVLLTGSEHGPQVWEQSENDKYGECKSVLLGAILTRSWNSDNDGWANNKLVWILGVNSDTKNAFTNAHPELMQTCVVALSFIANIIARQDEEGNWNANA